MLHALEFDTETPSELPEFRWSTQNEPYLSRLCRAYALDGLVAGSHSAYDRVRRACYWTSRRWLHDGARQPMAADPISILEEAASGGRFRCVEFSIVLAAVLTALGVPARRLALRTEDAACRESDAGHVVVEAYLREKRKWIMVDAQAGVIPVFEREPLSAVELQRALAERSDAVRVDRGQGTPSRLSPYFRYLAPYLFYFDAPLDNRVGVDVEKQRLILHPIGSEPLLVFQRKTPIQHAQYTHSLGSLYTTPQLAPALGG